MQCVDDARIVTAVPPCVMHSRHCQLWERRHLLNGSNAIPTPGHVALHIHPYTRDVSHLHTYNIMIKEDKSISFRTIRPFSFYLFLNMLPLPPSSSSAPPSETGFSSTVTTVPCLLSNCFSETQHTVCVRYTTHCIFTIQPTLQSS